MEIDRQFLEPRADAAELLQPADALLRDAAAAVGPPVEPRRGAAGRAHAEGRSAKVAPGELDGFY